ncbi:MAG: hypothetical protein NTX22_07585 [Ignavibacteriales bacterium]|nr:hypothetical protein [Ignavibacteriales bacterium]
MNYKRIISLLLFLQCVAITLFLNLSCKKSPTEPEDNSTPGRRDYVWTADTIKIDESLILTRIWGSSPTNVWAIGTSSWTATTIWHFNGKQWRCDSLSRNISPWAIFGLDSTEVWLGNINSTIWKYSNEHWGKYGEYKMEGYDYMGIMNFNGTSKNNIYGVGSISKYNSYDGKTVIMHYNGINWQFVNIPEVKGEFTDINIDNNTGTLVLPGFHIGEKTGFTGFLYTWDGKELKELYSGYDTFVATLNNKIYVTINQKIYKYKSGNIELWMDYTGTKFGGQIRCGRSEKDFFWGSSDGIAHYNGTDLQTIYKTSLVSYGGYIFDRDVFFITRDEQKTGYNVIIHGKLKQE